MAPTISIITVSFNAESNIEQTILSVISQTYKKIEYIVIDGGSSDGTIDIIKKYANSITYWISEPDKGIYDAMNKGIKIATGEWINFMNCGDTFADKNVLQSIFNNYDYTGIDVIYGNSLKITSNGNIVKCFSNNNIHLLKYHPIYRHGASFVRTSIQKSIPFDLSKKKFNYALDMNCINSIYLNGHTFLYVSHFILTYQEEGTSNHPFKNIYYNYLISIKNGFTFKAFFKFLQSLFYIIKQRLIKKIN